MGLFDAFRKATSNVHSRRQAAYYRRLKHDLRHTKLEKEKLRIISQTSREARRTQKELKRLQPRRGLRMPKLIGDLRQFSGHIPSDTELNQSLFGAPSPKRPTVARKGVHK